MRTWTDGRVVAAQLLIDRVAGHSTAIDRVADASSLSTDARNLKPVDLQHAAFTSQFLGIGAPLRGTSGCHA